MESLIEAVRNSNAAGLNHSKTVELLHTAIDRCRDERTLNQWLHTYFHTETIPAAHCTGYYQPEIQGSLTRSSDFPFPLYLPPQGTAPTRGEIELQGALSGRGLELAWVQDPVDLYFLHVQGSGILKLADGTRYHLIYAGNNGHTYTSIGSEMVKTGAISRDELSMENIKRYLRQNPDQAPAIMSSNERYVFFNLSETGPFTSSGTLPVPLRTLAADPAHYPPGTLIHLTLPDIISPKRKSSLLALVHDRGTAITGTGRFDLFCGSGEDAGKIAGVLNHTGPALRFVPRCPTRLPTDTIRAVEIPTQG